MPAGWNANAAVRSNVAYAALVTLDFGTADIIEIGPMTGALTLILVGASMGQHCTVVVQQDGVGSRAVTWPGPTSGYGQVIPAPPAATAGANLFTVYKLRYDGFSFLYGG